MVKLYQVYQFRENMASKNGQKAAQTVTAPKNATETALESPNAENPYIRYPLHIPGLLRAILCELWEVRQCLKTKN